MLKLIFAHAPRVFVWLLDLYGGSFDSHLPISLENEVLDLGSGILKKHQQFLKMEKWRYFQQHEKYRYHIAKTLYIW